MGRSPLIAAVILMLFCAATGAPAQNDAGQALTQWTIEDAEGANPQALYDEKPPVLEVSSEKTTQGSHSLHFITGTGYGGGYITKSSLPTPKNLSKIAENGVISFDLWVKNPADIRDANAGSLFEFRIGSTSNDAYIVWYIPSSLLKPGEWNKVILRMNAGRATLTGSSVAGTTLVGNKDASVENAGVDWNSIDYHRLALYCAGVPVEGYLDNMTASVVSDPLAVSRQTIALAATDPDSHFFEAKKAAGVGVFYPKYDIIPPDVRPDAFFTDDILNWDCAAAWTATFENCGSPVFCLSWDQALRGRRNAKVELTVAGSDARVILTPPSPIEISHAFNTLEFWVYGHFYNTTTISYKLKRPDGSVYTWTGGTELHSATGHLFHSWNLAHVVLPKMMPNGTKLVSIAITPQTPGQYIYHLDEMRAINYEDYLAKTPAPKNTHIGAPVKLPVNPNGACPTSAESSKTSTSIADGVGRLEYISACGDDVTYIYTPKTGTMSDISVSVKGKSTFLPTDGGGPVFSFADKTYAVGSTDVKAKCLSSRGENGDLVYVWQYTTPGGTAEVTYRLSLKGKTLQVGMSSDGRSVSSVSLGHASGLRDAKVIKIPFMMRAPRVLCNDGFFTTCCPDWYKTNCSKFAWSSGETVNGDTAHYTYDDPGIVYMPRTDGVRWPLKDTIYITTSSTFEDCLVNISNPPSPFKNVIKERLYRLASPVDLYKPSAKGWMQASRDMVDMYDKYGMDNVIVLFHGGIWSNCAARGPEPFHSRLTTSVATPGGDQAVIDLFKHMRDMGMYPGYYGGCAFWQPISQTWDYNNVALNPDGSWYPVWVQAYHMKPWHFPELTNTRYREQAAKFGGMAVYEDGWTSGDPWEYNDYDHRVPGSGRLIDTLQAMATGYRNEREAVGGPIFSEGNGSCFYTAGLNDGDYGKLFGYANGQSVEVRRPLLLVDFELRKVAPLHAPVSFDLGYWGFEGVRDLSCGTYKYLHHFLAAQIAFGTIGMMEPYARIYDDPAWKFDSILTNYFMMQQIQKRYIMEHVEDISYYDGSKLVSTSDAIRSGVYADNMLRIRYKNGLTIYVNCNWDKKSWTIEDGGVKYELPSGGWYAKQGSDFTEYSATVDGRRLDFVDSPEYTFINANGKSATLAGLTTDKIIVRHKAGKHKGQVLSYPQ